MTTYLQSDAAFGIKKETTYGTAVTVDAHLADVHPGDSLQPGIEWLQGQGLRVGRVGPAFDRRVKGKTDPGGAFTVDVNSVDAAILLEAAFGKVVTAGVAAPYGRLYTCAAGDTPPSYTIQKSTPVAGGASIQAHTFAGMVCSQLEFTLGNDAILEAAASWVGRDMDTATALVTPAYAAASNLFTFNSASVIIGGNPTTPTASAPSTGGTAVTNVRDFKLTVNNNLYTDRFHVGGAGKRAIPVYGQRQVSGSLTAEFDSGTLRDASLAGTGMALVFGFTGGTNELLQFTIPKIAFASAIPNAATDMTMLQLDWTGYEDAGAYAYALLQNTVAV